MPPLNWSAVRLSRLTSVLVSTPDRLAGHTCDAIQIEREIRVLVEVHAPDSCSAGSAALKQHRTAVGRNRHRAVKSAAIGKDK